ncbi:hypothetical protein TWF281_000120 [Arthrobotrys megalospora]
MPKRCLFFSVVAIIVVVIIVGVTVPVVVTRNSHSNHPPLPPANISIILPLYIYPAKNAWAPVYEKLNNYSYSGIEWTIIINPSDGPGEELNSDYRINIHRLNAARNVKLVGYVFTDYGRRNVADVEAEIAKYASWGLFQGIFFDETPQGHNQSVEDSITYLETITSNVRGTPGFLGQESVVIHNPGTPAVNPKLLSLGQNFTVVAEDTFAAYGSPADQQSISRLSAGISRTELGCLIHSIPETESQQGGLDGLLARLSQTFGHVFLTDRTSGYYNDYSGIWNSFVNSTSLMYS